MLQEAKPVRGGEEGSVESTAATAGPAPAPRTSAQARPAAVPEAPTSAPAPAQASASVAAAGEEATMPTRSGPHEERVEVQPDPGTFDRVLAEELAKGTERRVAEGKARRQAMLEARKKAQGG